MDKILVSACLLGERVRYDGRGKRVDHDYLRKWWHAGRLVPVCPEVAGGLGIPRPPAEISGGSGLDVLDGAASVITQEGDVTNAFLRGARAALNLAERHGVRVAILKEKSPSCGNEAVYDGTFTKRLIPGMGTTAALLERHGVRVFNEHQIDEAAAFLTNLEQALPLSP